MSLSIRNLKKSYVEPGGRRLPILNVDSFDIADAEQVVLIGSSGGGKTTLLNVIAGVTTADSGQVVIDGTDVTKLPEAGRDRFRALRTAPTHGNSWNVSGWNTDSIIARQNFLSESSSESLSREHSPTGRRCYWRTSRRRMSTRPIRTTF
jgi:ABC-type multidrug transport system ATPase subunit